MKSLNLVGGSFFCWGVVYSHGFINLLQLFFLDMIP